MTGPAPSLVALVETGVPIIVPGLARWLGVPVTSTEPDDTYESFLDRISQEAA